MNILFPICATRLTVTKFESTLNKFLICLPQITLRPDVRQHDTNSIRPTLRNRWTNMRVVQREITIQPRKCPWMIRISWCLPISHKGEYKWLSTCSIGTKWFSPSITYQSNDVLPNHRDPKSQLRRMTGSVSEDDPTHSGENIFTF